MEFSIYQKKIFDAVKNEKCNILVNAVAGSGKTTTLIECCKILPENVKKLTLAYNKHIANELQKKVPENTRATTTYGIGWSALMNHYKIGFESVDDLKINKIVNSLSKNWHFDDYETKKNYLSNIIKITNLCRLNLKIKAEQIKGFAKFYGYKDIDDLMVNRIIQIIQAGIKDTKTFDYTDMIFLPCINPKIFIPKYKYVFIDEVQDTNICQQMIFKKCIDTKNGGRFFAFGDPKQSIYAFMGANTQSFEKIANTPNTVTLPLSISYRCGKNIIEHAKHIVPYIEHNPDNEHDGIVTNTGDVLTEPQSGDYVLCRENEPLIKLFFHYIENNIQCVFNGKDLRTSVKAIVKTYMDKNYSINIMISELINELNALRTNLIAQGVIDIDSYDLYKEKKDKVEMIKAFSRLGSKTISELYDTINKYFSKRKGIILSTVHKAKGLEADRVFIIRPDLLPRTKLANPWEYEIEKNLHYVAITRAKKELHYDVSFDVESKKQ